MKRVTLALRRSRTEAHPMHRAVMDADEVSTAAVLAWDPGRRKPTTLSRLDGSRSAVESLVEDLSLVESYALSETGETTYAFVRQTRFEMDPKLADALAAPEILALPPVTFESDGTVEFAFVGTPPALSDLLGHLDDLTDCSVTGVAEYGGPAGGRRLTDRQREAIEAAVAVGFYDVPRTATLADVASELGCAESTASELVRKAQSAIVRGQVETE